MGKSRRTKPGENKTPVSRAVETQRDLARVHAVSLGAVQKWLEDPRWSEAGFSVTGPWGVKEIARQKEWRRDYLQDDRNRETAEREGDGQSPGALTMAKAEKIARIKLLVAKEENLRLEMGIKRGEYVKRGDAESERVAKFLAIKEGLMRVPPALRQLLADTSEPADVERILTEALRALCVEGFGGDAKSVSPAEVGQ